MKIHDQRISRWRGTSHFYLCDVKSSFDLFIKPGLNSARSYILSTVVAAILFTCFRLNYAVFKKKINPFEAVNRKNNFLEARDN